MFSFSAFSQFEVSKVSDVEVLKFPICRIKVKMKNANQSINPNDAKVLIKEMNLMSAGDSIVSLGNDNYLVYWTSRLPLKFPYVDVYFTFQENVRTLRFRMPNDYKLQWVRIMTPSAKPMVFFNKAAPNDSSVVMLNFKANPDNKENEYDYVWIDSIRTFTNYFRCSYSGSYLNWNKPPGKYPEGDYQLFIYFSGKEDRFYQDSLIIYYNGNQKVKVDLLANSYKFTTTNSIKVLEPKVGKVLTPCFLDTIVWTGGSRGLTYTVELSIDGGYNWKGIGETKDTFLIWKVPNSITEEAKIKVYQKFSPEQMHSFSDDYGYYNAKYENKARFLAASTRQGMLHEIIIDKNGMPAMRKKRVLVDNNDSTNVILTSALAYSKMNDDLTRELAVTYHSNLINEFFARDTLKIFKDEEDNPIKTIILPYIVKRMEVDAKYRYLTILPKQSNCLYFYDTKDYRLVKQLNFQFPISNFKYVPFGDSLQIVLMDNTVKTFLTNELREIKTINYNQLPIITDIANSPNGRFMAFGTLRIPSEDIPHTIYYTSFVTPIYVYEHLSGINIKAYYANTHTPMGIDFSPSSDRIIVGKETKDHITMRDLSSDMPVDYFNFSLENDNMINYSFAGEGHFVAAIMPDKSLYINKFRYTEFGIMEGLFSIRYTDIEIKPIVFEDQLIDYKSEKDVKSAFCNRGKLPLIVQSVQMKNYTKHWMYNLRPVQVPDTLLPGECLNFHITYSSLDTGKIRDTIIITTCAQTFYIPVESRVLPRNINFHESEIGFGEVCVNTPMRKKFKLLTNNDTIALNIQKIYFESTGNTAFRTYGKYMDIVVPPGEDYYAELEFYPNKTGDFKINFYIEYANNWKFKHIKTVTGKGIGTDVVISHQYLYFIPEIKTRTFTFKNNDEKPITLLSYNLDPIGTYRVNTPLPLKIMPKDSAIIEVEYLNDSIYKASLTFASDPCASNAKLYLGKYSSNSIISLLDTEADPRDEAKITIHLQNNENVAYNGTRFIESEFTINENIFLPFKENSVVSLIGGTGVLLRNEVVDSLRHIKFRVEGNFPKQGNIIEIRGYAGLTLPSESPISFTKENLHFGSAVQTETKAGKFKLIKLCGDKMLWWGKQNVKIIKYFPNPADKEVCLDVKANYNAKASIEIFNPAGAKVKIFDNLQVIEGANEYKINIEGLESGTYNAIFTSGSETSNFKFTVIK